MIKDRVKRRVDSRWRAVLLLLTVIQVVVALPAGAQQPQGELASLFGRVTDEADAPVAGAVVTLIESGTSAQRRTTLSDAEGAYRLVGVPAGRYRVAAAHLGFAAEEREVVLRGGERRRLDLALRIEAVVLEGIDVRARRDAARERARFETEAGVTARVVSAEQIKLLPGLAEADVLRSIEVLPGVISTSDFSSAFNVRGGSADQNLILLDGFPIFNPFHLGGLFSVFNSDALARAELFAGGFGAEYGGRVSSVLTVESRAGGGEGEGLRGEAGVSLLASRLALHGNLPAAVPRLLGGREGGWLLSGRRSYFDKLLAPVVDFPYHLTDLQGHINVGVAGGGRIRFTGYTGRDVLDLSDFTPPGGSDAESVLRLRWNWGNDVLGARWEQPLGGGAWLLDTRAGFSRFRDELVLLDFDDTRFGGAISQLMLRSDLRRDFASASVATGIEVSRMEYENSAETGGTSFFSRADHGVLGSGYGALRWRPAESWIVEPGVRLDVWNAADTTRATFSPRLAVKRFLDSDQEAAVKLAIGRYTQFLHSLRNEEFPLSNDVWILAGPSVPAVVSDQLQVGIEQFWGEEWYASVEAYGRLFRGVTEFNPAGDPNDVSDDVHDGTGRSYGLDVLVRRSMGRLTGWTTVSLLRAERSFPNPLADGWEDLPPTVSFPPIFDRRVDVDLVLEYRLPWEVQAGARWNFGSGLPYTRPVAQYVGWEYDLREGDYRLPTSRARRDGVPLYVVLGERNTQRYPAYHRLDMTLRRTFQPRWGTLTPYLQVLNGYNRRNVLFYFYNYNRNPPTRSGISMFPLLPTIGVEASF
ncbi:MAG TPA: TonB-dependent receptor [Longimicrobiaceae bacterium]|nr:TonB-dependent receptor [Longimicrobiaceae bacterium]